MASEAQKRANRKYRQSLKRITINFRPTEEELYEYLSTKGNKQQYIKDLIVDDFEHNASHKVIAYHEGMNMEFRFGIGSKEDCENYIKRLEENGGADFPIDCYKVVEI